jgi:hypothetical protein
MDKISSNDMIDALKAIHAKMQAQDPLLKRGIERDWVCVMHPEMADWVMRQATDTLPSDVWRGMTSVTGRKTFIIESAPRGVVEYMPEPVMKDRYAAYFKWQAEVLAEHFKGED